VVTSLEVLLDGMVQVVPHFHRGLVILDESNQAPVVDNEMEWIIE
jgi:hypothetical protein